MCFLTMARKRQPFRMRIHGQHLDRSFLLEDYNSNRYPNLQLADIVSHVVEFAKNRKGSKFIQDKMDDATDHCKDSVFNEMRPVLLELMTDPYGNFVVQKFFDVGNMKHHQELNFKVRKHFEDLSLNKYGCRVVQMAVKTGTISQKFFVLEPCVGECFFRVAKDQNGNHVLQKSFLTVSVDIQNYLFAQLQPVLVALCFDVYGCRVVQCILQHGNDAHRKIIFEGLICYTLPLTQNLYGNYVVQHALEYCAPADRNRMIHFILCHVIDMSLQKYSSNVVETCLSFATIQQQQATMHLFCIEDGFWLNKFCTEPYGNYVVQKLIGIATIDQVRTLYDKISPFFAKMERHVCGRKVINKLEERLYDQEIQVEFQRLGLLNN